MGMWKYEGLMRTVGERVASHGGAAQLEIALRRRADDQCTGYHRCGVNGHGVGVVLEIGR